MAVTSVRFPPARVAGGNPHRTRRRIVLAVLVLAFWGYLFGAARPAWAHAELIGSTPANGSGLATSPSEIRLRFSERVNAVRDGVTLLDSAGAVQVVGTPSSGLELVLAVIQDRFPTVSTPSLWRVVSADSHPIHGAFVFSVGDAVAVALPGGAQSDVDSGLAAAFWLARWLGYAGLALLAGGRVFPDRVLAQRMGLTPGPPHRRHRLADQRGVRRRGACPARPLQPGRDPGRRGRSRDWPPPRCAAATAGSCSPGSPCSPWAACWRWR